MRRQGKRFMSLLLGLLMLVSTFSVPVAAQQAGDDVEDFIAALEELLADDQSPVEPTAAALEGEDDVDTDGDAATVLTDTTAKLASLDLIDNGHLATMVPAFDPDITEYTMVVEEDTLGVRVQATAEEGGTVSVTGSMGVAEGALGGGVTVITMEPAVALESGLTRYPGYEDGDIVTATITVENGQDATDYTVTITRKAGQYVSDLFEQKVFTDSAGTNLNYNIYVPTDIEPGEQLPIVWTMHGTGQRASLQTTDMVVMRSNQASVWAKDSEEGIRRCIVIAPQSNAEGWRMSSASNQTPNASDNAAYELLLSVMDEYAENVDVDRIYATGLSMGGGATWTAILNHPNTFAAAFINAYGTTFTDAQIQSVKHLPILNVWAADEVNTSFVTGCRALQQQMDVVGHENYVAYEYPSGTYLYETGHFSWVPAYADASYREWLFSQTRTPVEADNGIVSAIGITKVFDLYHQVAAIAIEYEEEIVAPANAADSFLIVDGDTQYIDEIYLRKASNVAPVTAVYTNSEPSMRGDQQSVAGKYLIVELQEINSLVWSDELDQLIPIHGSALASWRQIDNVCGVWRTDYSALEITQQVEIRNAAGEVVSTPGAIPTLQYDELINLELDKFETTYIQSPHGDHVMNYSVYFPEDYDESKLYPLVLHVTGNASRLNYNQQDEDGNFLNLGINLVRDRVQHNWASAEEDVIVLSLQNWMNHPTADAYSVQDTAWIVNYFLENYSIDPDRVYCYGSSYGTMHLSQVMANHPDMFAAYMMMNGMFTGLDNKFTGEAAAALSGWTKEELLALGDEVRVDYDDYIDNARELLGPLVENRMAVTIWHGVNDDTIAVSRSLTMYEHMCELYAEAGLSQEEIDQLVQLVLVDNDEFHTMGQVKYHDCLKYAFKHPELLTWVLGQSRQPAATADVKLTSLDLLDNGHLATMVPAFDPDITEYTMLVEEDTLGVRVQASAEAGNTVTVEGTLGTADNALGGGVTVITMVPAVAQESGLTRYPGYDEGDIVTATITVENEQGESGIYTVTITRKAGQYVSDLFEQKVFTGESGATLNYNIYVPTEIEPGEKLPIVWTMHGTGQRASLQTTDMVVKRSNQASVWAKDSENGIRRCIVIAPQSNADGWSAATEDSSLNLAYELLLDVMDEYAENVDENRVYATGLSMGGGATWNAIYAHPGTFAAAFVHSVSTSFTDEQLETVKHIPMRNVWAADEIYTNIPPANRQMAARMEAIGHVDYEDYEYPSGTYLYENGHFSWVPAYNTEEWREWLFDQSRTPAEEPKLTSLDLIDNGHLGVMEPAFDPDITEYTMVVEEDTLGVRVRASAEAGSTVTVEGTLGTADNALGGGVTVITMESAVALESGLTRYPGYEDGDIVTATITVENEQGGSSVYTVTITRKPGQDLLDLFEQKVFTSETGATLNYNIYVPGDIQPGEKLPIVWTMHGTGQRASMQTTDMVIMRSNQASVYAKDSEAGIRRCIVIAPQSNADGWSMTTETASLNIAYELLLDVMDEYAENVDANRIYATGLSMGGGATWNAIYNYPDTFAAAFINAISTSFTDEQLETIKHIPIRNVWAADEVSASTPVNNRLMEDRMAAIGHVDYEGYEYPSGTYLYETGHFSWVPAYNNEEWREWMFAQSKPESAKLTSLEVADGSHSGIALEPAFDPDVTEYTLHIQEDILGVQFKAAADGEIEIIGSSTGNNYPDGVELHDDGSVTVLTIAPDHFDDYDSEGHTTATITVTQGGASTVYTVNIIRADGSWSYELFEQFEGTDGYYDEEYDVYVPYNIYVPSDLQPGEQLPVVYVMHGGGQSTQTVDMILKRTQEATIWAKDSETDSGRRAIVLAPKADSILNAPYAGWSSTQNGQLVPSVLAEASYNLLLKTMDDYNSNVDRSRVYVVGLSMGGGGGLAMIAAYPETFAAAYISCPAGVLSESQIEIVKDIPIYFNHAAEDPTVPVSNTRTMIARLEAVGATVYYDEYEAGTYFYSNPHFCWVKAYQQEETREWLFAQSKPVVEVESIAINSSALTIVRKGAAFTLEAIITPSNATDKTVTWKSGNTNIAVIDELTGDVVVVGQGMCMITATSSNGKTATIYISAS